MAGICTGYVVGGYRSGPLLSGTVTLALNCTGRARAAGQWSGDLAGPRVGQDGS